jgi:hypothetical protein
MKVLNIIPFQLEESEFRQRAHLERLPGESLGELLAAARPLARPKALYRVCTVGRCTEDTVEIDGTLFSSRVLAANLRHADRVFPYVATCGTELEALEAGCEDLMARYCLDAVKEMALLAARSHLLEHLRAAYGAEELSSMNPGSGDARLWPIGQQRPLFQMLGDVEGAIGVQLTPSFLMLPNKSVSGIFFPAKEHFESCQLCSREDCPRRRAPFSGTLQDARSAGHP